MNQLTSTEWDMCSQIMNEGWEGRERKERSLGAHNSVTSSWLILCVW